MRPGDAARCQNKLIESKVSQREHQNSDDHAIHAPPGLRRDRFLRPDILIAFQALRRHLEHPTENQRGKESDREQNHDAARQPIGRAEHREHCARHLHQQPRADQIQSRETDDVAPLQFGEKVVDLHSKNPIFFTNAAKRGSSCSVASIGS